MNTKNIIICGININIFITSNHIIIPMASRHLTLVLPCSSAILARRPEHPVALRGAWGEPSSSRPCAIPEHHVVMAVAWGEPARARLMWGT